MVGCLLCSMARIQDILDGSLDKRKVRGLVPYYGQDGFRAQVQIHNIHKVISLLSLKFRNSNL